MVGLALVLLALRARNILIRQLDSVVSYSARSRRCSNCMHAQKSLAFFVCGLCRSHFVISSVFFFFIFSGVTATSCSVFFGLPRARYEVPTSI